MSGSVVDQRAFVLGLLTSPTATAMARNALRGFGLANQGRIDEDLIQIVTEKALRHFTPSRAPISDGKPDALVRYVHVMFRNAACDLLKAADSKVATVPLELNENAAAGVDHDALLWDSPEKRSNAVWNAARASVWSATDPNVPAWVTAAALTHLTVDEDPDVPTPDHIVRPLAPAVGQDAAWVGLQYAGRTDCFASPDTATVRKRRSKAIARVHAMVGAALLETSSGAVVRDPHRGEASGTSR